MKIDNKNKLSETLQNKALLGVVQIQTSIFFIFIIYRPRTLDSIYHKTYKLAFFESVPK